MYNDYKVTYVSRINEYIVPITIGIIILILILIICLIALFKIFKKANRSGIAAIIPFYNLLVMLEIANKPSWQLIIFLIPILNVIVYCQVMFKIAKSFRKTNSFAISTVFFPFIFLPILGFSDSEYIGINKEAMMGVSEASSIPTIKEEDLEATAPDEQKQSKPADISIGGGVYQKEYESTLLNVDKENINHDLLASFRVDTKEEEKPQVEEPEKTGIDVLKNINFIDDNKVPEVVAIEEKPESTASPIPEVEPINAIPTITETVIPINGNNHSEAIPVISSPTISNDFPNLDSDYVKCKHCGAMIKKDAPKCFMCGQSQ